VNIVVEWGKGSMDRKHRWFLFLLNTFLGGGYVAAILLLIYWVASSQVGTEGFLIPFGLFILLVFGWLLADYRKNSPLTYSTPPLTQNELS
jgi:hypothetical protein